MSEEKKCPKCGEKMIYYPGRRSFGKTGKYICNCKDSEGEKVPASGEKCRTCEAWNPEEFASECEDMYNGIRPLRCEKLPEPSENDDKKIKIWCYECHDDYFIFDSWNGSECPHCGCWNKKDSEGENETEPLYQPRRIGEKLKYLEKEKPPEIQDCTECDEPHKYDETGTLYCTSNQCKEAEPEKECQKKVKITDEFQFENEEGRIILYNDGSLWLQRKDTPKTFWYYLKDSGGEKDCTTCDFNVLDAYDDAPCSYCKKHNEWRHKKDSGGDDKCAINCNGANEECEPCPINEKPLESSNERLDDVIRQEQDRYKDMYGEDWRIAYDSEKQPEPKHATCVECKYYPLKNHFSPLNRCNQCEHNELFEPKESSENETMFPMSEVSLRAFKEETERILISEFVKAYKEDKMKVIDLNIKRNMNADSHIEYNTIFDERIEKWEA